MGRGVELGFQATKTGCVGGTFDGLFTLKGREKSCTSRRNFEYLFKHAQNRCFSQSDVQHPICTKTIKKLRNLWNTKFL